MNSKIFIYLKILFLVLGLVVINCMITTNNTQANERTIEDGIYEIETKVNCNKVIEVIDASKISGANVQIFERNSKADCQKVEVKYIGEGYYTIVFLHSNMLLDVANGITEEHTNVWQCRNNEADAQKWIIQECGDGYYNIISKISRTYLTVAGGGTSNCTNIEICSSNNNDSQKFKFNKINENNSQEEKIKLEKTIEDGIYEIETKVNTNKVIEVIDASKVSGANVQIFEKNPGEACQKVELKYIGEGYYDITFLHSKMLLDVADGKTADHTNVWQCRDNGADAQKWIIQECGDGYYNIISKLSKTYLTVAGGKTTNCTNIEICSKNNNDSQKFKLKRTDGNEAIRTISDGVYRIETGVEKNKVLDVINASKKNGGNVQIFTRNTLADCQRINVKYLGEGYYKLTFLHSEKVLDVAGGKTEEHTNVYQSEDNGNDSQKWVIKDVGNGYYNIISKNSGKYLTVANGDTVNCTNIEICSKNEDNRQKFKFEKLENNCAIKTIEDGIYEIETKVDSNKVIEVIDASKVSGANVQIFEKNSKADCEKVEVKYIGGGYYTITFVHSNMLLDVSNGKTADHTNVWQCRDNGSDAQKWIIQESGDGYYNIVSKQSKTYLTVAGGKTANCTNIEICSTNNTDSQLFKFVKVEKINFPIKGIDVSIHNGVVDWETVKNSGIDFAILRCGFGENITSQDDAYFIRNMNECERLGIKYGVYIYSYALNENGAISEANHVLRLIKGHDIAYGVWFDMEDADGYKEKKGMPSDATLVNICKKFCDIIKANGYDVGIYASYYWFVTMLNDQKLDEYDKWVAQWSSRCSYTKPYKMWQYTATGKVNGISGNVDMNYMYW